MAPTAFALFAQERKAEIGRAQTFLNIDEICSMVSREWLEMTEESKKKFNSQASLKAKHKLRELMCSFNESAAECDQRTGRAKRSTAGKNRAYDDAARHSGLCLSLTLTAAVLIT